MKRILDEEDIKQLGVLFLTFMLSSIMAVLKMDLKIVQYKMRVAKAFFPIETQISCKERTSTIVSILLPFELGYSEHYSSPM